MARPTLFTVPRLTALLIAVRTEPTLTAAARTAGISYETVRRWMRDGARRTVPTGVRLPNAHDPSQATDYEGVEFGVVVQRLIADHEVLDLARLETVAREGRNDEPADRGQKPPRPVVYDWRTDGFRDP